MFTCLCTCAVGVNVAVYHFCLNKSVFSQKPCWGHSWEMAMATFSEHRASSSGYKGYSAVTPGREFRDASRQGVSHMSELAMAFGLKVKGTEAGAGSFGRRDVYLSVKHGQGWGEWEGSRKAEGLAPALTILVLELLGKQSTRMPVPGTLSSELLPHY